MNEGNNLGDFQADDSTNENSQYYNEVGFQDYKGKNPMLKYIIIIAIIVILTIALLVFRSLQNRPKLTDIKIEFDEIIYAEKTSSVKITAQGSGNLSKTTYKITADNKTVKLSKAEATGEKINLDLTPQESGTIKLKIEATAGSKKVTKNQNFYVCKELSNKSVEKSSIEMNINESYIITVDLGENAKCYSNVTYESENEEVATVDEYGKITSIKEGTTTITIKQDKNEIKLNVTVKK